MLGSTAVRHAVSAAAGGGVYVIRFVFLLVDGDGLDCSG